MKKVFSVKRIVKIISLLVAVIITALFMQQYILLHYDSNRLRLDGFYLEEKDTVDIALIGSSEVYASFAPGMAYDKFGFTSYDYATASCTPTAAITQVKEVMDNQSPKMILMEVNAFLYGADKDGQDLNAFKESSIRNYIDNIPMNDNKKAFLDEYVDKDLHIEYYLPIIKYHSAWNDYPDSIRYLRSCFEQQVRGESVGFVLRAVIHLEEVEFLQCLACEIAVELVMADFVRQNHVLPNIIQIGVEENKAVAPLAEVHTQKF